MERAIFLARRFLHFFFFFSLSLFRFFTFSFVWTTATRFLFSSREDWFRIMCCGSVCAQSGGIASLMRVIRELPGISEEINDEQNSAILVTGQIKAFGACLSVMYVLCEYSARVCSLGNLKTLKHQKKEKKMEFNPRCLFVEFFRTEFARC